MAKTLNHIESEALKLPIRSRAHLAEKLIYSLEKKGYSKIERLWAKEAQKRYKAMASGKVKGVPASKVLREIRAKLK
jgi:putative addiction module component (TIGR02574 family)